MYEYDLDVYQQRSEQRKCGIHTQWNYFHLLGIVLCYLQGNGCNWQ